MSIIFSHVNIILLIVFSFLFLLERFSVKFLLLKSYKDGGFKRWGKNLFLGIVNHCALPLLTVPFLMFVSKHALFQRPENLYSVIFVFFDIFILDFTSYWFHRFSHKIPFLWRFHETHHLDPGFDSTTTLRIHFVELIFANIFKAIPIFLFAIPAHSLLTFEIILISESLFHHSNIVIPRKINQFLGKIIVTPDTHAVHHHAYIPDTDSNYGFLFIFWDKMFGSFNKAKRTKNWRMGLEYVHDLDLIDLFLSPFHSLTTKQRIKNANTSNTLDIYESGNI